MACVAAGIGGEFTMRRFFDEFNAAGVIPVSLIRRQMTGGPAYLPARRAMRVDPMVALRHE